MKWLILLLPFLLVGCGWKVEAETRPLDEITVSLYKRVEGDQQDVLVEVDDLTPEERDSLRELLGSEETSFKTMFCFKYPYNTKTREFGEIEEVDMIECDLAQLIERTDAAKLFDIMAEKVYGQRPQ